MTAAPATSELLDTAVAAADVIYGVTMQESGISRTVSMKFAEYEQNKELQAGARRGATPPPAPAG